MTEPLLFAYQFDGQGGGEALATAQLSERQSHGGVIWVHLDAAHAAARDWLQNQFPELDPLIHDALLADETRPRLTPYGNGALLILRGVNLNEDAAPEDMVSIRLWVEQRLIITVRKRQLKAIRDIETKLRQGAGPCDSGDLVTMLVARLFERMAPVFAALDEVIDKVEEDLLDHAHPSLRDVIVQARKRAIIFKRYITPQRDAIMGLRHAEFSWLEEPHKRHLLESYNHITRYSEDLDAIRERAQIIKDELQNILSDRLNRNMYVLSVVAAIFLPLGFLTGLLGVNIGGIPGQDVASAFMIFCALLAIAVLMQIALFKWLKWF